METPKQNPDAKASPRTRGTALKTVKKSVKESMGKAKEAVKDQAKPTSDTDESPERYAENRIEQSAEYISVWAI